MINIDIDLKEISQEQADGCSTFFRIKGYIPSKSLIRTEQHLYQQTKYRRLHIINSISTEILENLRALSTYNSRTVNYSSSAADDEWRKHLIPLIVQLFYDEKYSNMVTTPPNEKSSWLAILSSMDSAVEYASMDVPITGIHITATHLRNCNYLPAKSCDGHA